MTARRRLRGSAGRSPDALDGKGRYPSLRECRRNGHPREAEQADLTRLMAGGFGIKRP